MANSAAVNWTKEQREGITTTGVSLLVSAAAGSGKTAVLAERCAYLVCDADTCCAVDQLLVVTFTEAAAAQMKERIEAALRRRRDLKPTDARLQSQLALIDRAQVSTLHGFCSRLLRQHFHLVDLDPSFRILDADEASLLRAEVARDLFADRYETDDAGIFQKFIDDYGDGDDARLQSHVIRTHDLLCSLVDPRAWITSARARLENTSPAALKQLPMGLELAAIIRTKLATLAGRCDKALKTLRSLDGFNKVSDYVANLQGILGEWVVTFGDGNFDALATAVRNFVPGRKPPVRKDTPGAATADAAVESVRGEMGKDGSLFPFIRCTTAEWADGLRAIRPGAETFLDLVAEFGSRYTAAKTRLRGIDFADLERLALRVLRQETDRGYGPSAIAQLCHRQIHHVLVDEYQDINEVQDEILRLVSRECVGGAGHGGQKPGRPPSLLPNLFCVGDVKQSIYGFRLAEPARFLEKQARFRSAARGLAKVIDLQANFRSRGKLLESINALFEKLMTAEAADISYDDSQKLRPHATFPDDAGQNRFVGAPVELHLLPRVSMAATEEDGEPDAETAGDDLDRTEREASFIAHRIKELMGLGGKPAMEVFDKETGGFRPLRYRDVVILLRSMQFKAEQVAGVLRQHGVPVHRDSGTGFFGSMEIRDVLALLALLDNSQQDIPLAAVLRSPLSGVAAPEDSLARIRLEYPAGETSIPFHEATTRYAQEKGDELAARLRDFFEQLAHWRHLGRQRPLADLIWTIYDESGYLTFCSGLENGAQRYANLIALHERAGQFGTFARQGLYRFLRFLDDLRKQTDLGQRSVVGEAEDVVRVMSVHKSKGGEFPVVFMPDLGKKINLQSASGPILVDRLYQLGLSAVDDVKRVRYPSLAYLLVQRRLKQQMLAEELRVLYVAMTRAKEHLVLVGTCAADKPEKWDALWADHTGPLPAEVVLGGSTLLDWIGAATSALRRSNPNAYTRELHPPEEIADWAAGARAASEPPARLASLAALIPLDPPPDANPLADEVKLRFGSSYRHEPFTRLPASISVTEFAKGRPQPTLVPPHPGAVQVDGAKKSAACDGLLPRPRLLTRGPTPVETLSAADAGTATHLVLQHLQFSGPWDTSLLGTQIDHMLRSGRITELQARVVNRESIDWFVATDLGRMLCQASPTDLIREVPFNLALSPTLFAEFPSLDPADQVMLRGRIDLLVRQPDGYHIVDYKTDNVRGAGLEERVALYARQVKLYRNAIERFTGQAVIGVDLVFLTPRVIRSV